MTPARDNPFAVQRVEALIPFDPSWLNTDWDSIVQTFRDADYSGAVVGPHGSGKTAFLDAFQQILAEKTGMLVTRLFLNEEKKELTRHEKLFLTNSPDSAATVIFLDGAEQLNFFDRTEFKRLSYGYGGVLKTRHVKKRRESVILETKTTPEMLADFVYRLMPEFSGGDEKISEWFEESGGNIREALSFAYDHVSEA